MLKFDEARTRLLALAREHALGSERISVESALGRVLAEDVVSPRDLPAFDHSAMDGYAVRVADLASTTTLPVIGEAKTGELPPPLVANSTMRIFTGAPIPEGADAVVMQEEVTRDGDRASFDVGGAKAPRAGASIRRRGEDLAEGRVALARGTRLRSSHVALAATCDRAWLTVARRPMVTILATGDELRAPGTPAFPGSIPESNALAIHAMAKSAGASARIAPIVGDLRDATQAAIAAALQSTDVLVTVGGASVGDHDLVRPCLEAAGVVLDFWKVAMKPGKPLMVGRKGDTIVVGLPGNPASAMVTFALFGIPLLRALVGDETPLPVVVPARLLAPVRHAPGRIEFVRARLSHEGGTVGVTPLANQASGAVTSMAAADALLRIPEDAGALEAGATVDVIPFSEVGL